ncbi:MAG TPA: class I SAM-dependent methyltransferase [Acidimicrobiia bacterium]
MGSAREQREREFWATSPEEQPGAFSLRLLTHKMGEARVLLEKLNAFRDVFAGAATIVELGAGQAWASCAVAHEFGDRHRIVATDIAFDAVVSHHRWEELLDGCPSGVAACRSASLPFRDGSVDLVFAFAAAHHFGTQRTTLLEVARVLRPGGHALYLHEPACPPWIYPVAYRRVMRKRPVVPEDVLRYPEIEQLGEAAGLATEVRFAPTTTYRAPVETVYYLALSKLRPLQRVLPCTADFVFTKR